MNPVAYVALFGAGVASFLAPCVLPLVPAYLGMAAASATASTRRMIGSTSIFIAGFAVVFAAMGALAGALGSRLTAAQSMLQRVGGLTIIVFGLLLLGVFGGPLLRELRFAPRQTNGGFVRPLVMGITFGAAWTPCVGPLLGTALLTAAGAGNPLTGATLLGAYAFGIGVPFLATSLALASWPSVGRQLRRVSTAIERVSGVTLILLGILLVTGQYAHLISLLAAWRA